MDAELAVELHNVHTTYEGEKKPAIHDISLAVKKGEFVAIIGPNGAGKTTLLETMNGILPYVSGEGFVLKKNIKQHPYEIRKDIGYVIQNFEIDPRSPFLCKDVVMMGRTGKIGLLRLPSKKDWEAVWYSMSLVGMVDFAQRSIGKVSGGEFQKILLARALAQEPQILLLDEPFANLDVTARRQIEILLNRLHEKDHKTIIMVSHDLSFIPVQCSRVIVLDKGRIIRDDTKDAVLSNGVVEAVFSSAEAA